MDVPALIQEALNPALPDPVRQAAELFAQGMTVVEVCSATGLTAVELGVWNANRDFKELRAKLQDEFVSGVKARVQAQLHRKAEAAVDKIGQIMDTGDRTQRNQLAAAEMIIDRVLPRKGDGPGGTAIQINISTEERARMEIAAEEAGLA